MSIHRIRILALACMCAIAPAFAAEPEYRLDIKPQPLSRALQEFAAQSGLQIVFYAKAAEGRRAGAVAGSLTATEALQRLLAGTDLQFELLDPHTVAIRSRQEQPAAGNSGGTGAQSQQALPDRIDSRRDERADREPSAASTPMEASDLDTIIVTGTLIRGIRELPAPTIVIGREDIENSGYQTVEAVFNTLPQNFAEISSQGAGSSGTSAVASNNIALTTSVSLRGLGPQSTLSLLNGQRRPGAIQGRAVDVSAIPVSIIERMEIITGGKSAIYGSDAVAGVVNIVTRRDFEGAETSASYGASANGGDRMHLGQVFGMKGDRGGFVAAYDYSRSDDLDATDAGVVRQERSSFGIVPEPGGFDLLPETEKHTAYFSGELDVGSTVSLHGDALVARRSMTSDSNYAIAGSPVTNRTMVDGEEYSVAGGADIDLGSGWMLSVSGTTGRLREEARVTSSGLESEFVPVSGLSQLSAIVDGAFNVGSQAVKTAFGVERRREGYRDNFGQDEDRDITSAFGEVFVPLKGGDGEGGAGRVELSLAARYSRYSDVGSSFDPQLGILWAPSDRVTLRATYASAFRAPDLYSQYRPQSVYLIALPDPTSATGETFAAVRLGGNDRLQPETADTWTLGVDYVPDFAPTMKASLSLFSIDYEDRIEVPTGSGSFFTALQSPGVYESVIDRAPSADDIRALYERDPANFLNLTEFVAYDPAVDDATMLFPGLIVFDNRYGNLARERVVGIDAGLQGWHDTGRGELSYGVNATWYQEYTRRLLPGSPEISQIGRTGRPARFRSRLNLGYESPAFGVFGFLNYTDAYRDDTALPSRRIDPHVTVDVNLVGKVGAVIGRAPEDLKLSLAVENLFDRRPPLLQADPFGIVYDRANASALGRYVSLSLRASW